MRNPEDSPRHWRKWLQTHGISDAIDRQVGPHYRARRRAFERMWTIAYAGTVAGAILGVIVSVIFVKAFVAAKLPSAGILIMAVGAPLAASIIWWAAYLTMRRRRRWFRNGLIPGQDIDADDQYADRILETLAEELAKSELGPQYTAGQIDHLTHSTLMVGLREVPTSELERQLLERLQGSAFVPAQDGGIFVFKLGKPCSRCQAKTRLPPLRLLHVPAHWAASNGYQRLKDLPYGGRHLSVVPQRMSELPEFLRISREDASHPSQISFAAEFLLCDSCGDEAIRRGLLRPRTATLG